MSDPRDEILGRIRSGLRSSVLPDACRDHPVSAMPRRQGGAERFTAELEKLGGRVVRVAARSDVPGAVSALFGELGWKETLAWERTLTDHPALAAAMVQAGVRVLTGGDLVALATVPVGLTGADAALADSGTLVLQNLPGQPAPMSLLPEVHVALLDVRRIYPSLPDYLAVLNPRTTVCGASNLVFVTGPSRTADIEMALTIGVHGPGRIVVVMWDRD